MLKELKIKGFRSFFEEQTLRIDPEVTVLTGANDTGKSAVIDLFSLMSKGTRGSQEDANIHQIADSGKIWNDDDGIYAIATFEVTETTDLTKESLRPGSEVDVKYSATSSGKLHQIIAVRNEKENTKDHNHFHLKRLPRAIHVSGQIPENEKIRTRISKSNLNPNEDKLLTIAFGKNYWDILGELHPDNRAVQKDTANDTLNSKLNEAKPDSLAIQFNIDFADHDPLEFRVGLRDNLNSRAPLHVRGAGFQKLVYLMFVLLTVDLSSEHVLITIDEPENSLHADAQHSLRRVLEEFATHENMQVIYATHSPAMINPTRPQSLRLLTREHTDAGIATTRINNKPYIDSNFQCVRAALGVLPTDSLMFASIAVIVEGPTERLALNRLVDKLVKEGDPEKYKNLKLLWRLSFVVSAGGTGNIRYWIEFAKSQTVAVIVLLDGDSTTLAEKLANEHKDIFVLCFDKGKEFEEVINESVYFEALAEVIPGEHEDLKNKFDAWLEKAGLNSQMMFTKRIEKWLKTKFTTSLDKPKVIDRAIEIAKLDDIDLEKIDELIEAIRKAAENL